MRTKLKAISLLVVVLMLIAISLPGCVQKTQVDSTQTPPKDTAPATTEKAPEEKKMLITYEGEVTGSLPITDKPITFTYWSPFKPEAAKIMDSFAENPMWIEYQRLTGIKLDFIHPTIKQEQESFQLMIASQDLADIIEFSDGDLKLELYPGGPDQAIKDGAFLRLNEYIDKYAPNYQRILKFLPEIEKGVKTDEGNIFSFQMIEKTVQPAYGGPTVRIDWLEDLNIPIPETIDDWYEMLKTFRDKKGAKAPLLIDNTGGTDCYYSIIGSFGVSHKFHKTGNKVIFGPYEPGFGEYMKTMNKWYSEKLIDQDFLSHDGCTGANVLKKIANGETGAFYAGFYHFQKIEDVAWEQDPKFKIAGVPYPVLKKGDHVTIRQYNEHVRGRWTFISGKAKYPVEVVKMLDFNYSDQGTMLMNYGVEGVHYNMVNGKPVFTEAVTNHPDFPNTIEVKIFAKHEGPFIRDYARTFYSYRQNALDAMNLVWNGDNSGMMPLTMSMTADEGMRYSKIMSDVNTYVKEMLPKFIMGVEPLSKLDQYYEQLKKMNIEEAIKIQQASLDRFNKR